MLITSGFAKSLGKNLTRAIYLTGTKLLRNQVLRIKVMFISSQKSERYAFPHFGTNSGANSVRSLLAIRKVDLI